MFRARLIVWFGCTPIFTSNSDLYRYAAKLTSVGFCASRYRDPRLVTSNLFMWIKWNSGEGGMIFDQTSKIIFVPHGSQTVVHRSLDNWLYLQLANRIRVLIADFNENESRTAEQDCAVRSPRFASTITYIRTSKNNESRTDLQFAIQIANCGL